jgi:predicted peptidase
MWRRWPVGPYGFFDGYNETFVDIARSPKSQPNLPFWVDKACLGIDQGPIVLMLENYRSGFLWDLMKRNPYIVKGLQRAGFKGGWLEKTSVDKSAPAIAFENGENAKTNPAIPCDPSGLFQRKMYKNGKGDQLAYQLMAPAGKSQKKYPLVIFLHGQGERGSRNYEQMTNGVFAFCEDRVLDKHPHYLLVPQCPPDMRWAGSIKDGAQIFKPNPTLPGEMLLELIDNTIKENPNIDPKRIYITGLSMGAIGAFDLMMRRPDLFAAAVTLCGAGEPSKAAMIKHIPIWVFHGNLDDIILPDFSRKMVNALKKAGSKVKYTEYSSLRHDIWYQTYYNPEVLNWLFLQRKSK